MTWNPSWKTPEDRTFGQDYEANTAEDAASTDCSDQRAIIRSAAKRSTTGASTLRKRLLKRAPWGKS